MTLAAGRVMILVVGMPGMETGDCGTWPRTSLAQITELSLMANCIICMWHTQYYVILHVLRCQACENVCRWHSTVADQCAAESCIMHDPEVSTAIMAVYMM